MNQNHLILIHIFTMYYWDMTYKYMVLLQESQLELSKPFLKGIDE